MSGFKSLLLCVCLLCGTGVFTRVCNGRFFGGVGCWVCSQEREGMCRSPYRLWKSAMLVERRVHPNRPKRESKESRPEESRPEESREREREAHTEKQRV